MISGKWYLDRGMRLFRRFFSLNNHSLVSLLKYRDRDKVRLIRRLKRVNEQLSLLHRCDPEPRVLRFHETLRFLKYIKKPGNHHQRFESTPKEFPHDFELFYFFQADVFVSYYRCKLIFVAFMNHKKENSNILSIIFRLLIKQLSHFSDPIQLRFKKRIVPYSSDRDFLI